MISRKVNWIPILLFFFIFWFELFFVGGRVGWCIMGDISIWRRGHDGNGCAGCTESDCLLSLLICNLNRIPLSPNCMCFRSFFFRAFDLCPKSEETGGWCHLLCSMIYNEFLLLFFFFTVFMCILCRSVSWNAVSILLCVIVRAARARPVAVVIFPYLERIL